MTQDPFGEVLSLPIVIPLGLVVFVMMLLRLRARGLFSLPRVAVSAVLATYAAGIVANTIFPIFLDKGDGGEPWTPGLVLIPFHDYEVGDALTNTVVFVPLGALVALIVARPSWVKVVASAVALSLTIELTQLITQPLLAGGHIADINDLIFNVIGGALGFGLFLILTSVPGLSRLIDHFRWTKPSATHLAADRRVPLSRAHPDGDTCHESEGPHTMKKP